MRVSRVEWWAAVRRDPLFNKTVLVWQGRINRLRLEGWCWSTVSWEKQRDRSRSRYAIGSFRRRTIRFRERIRAGGDPGDVTKFIRAARKTPLCAKALR